MRALPMMEISTCRSKEATCICACEGAGERRRGDKESLSLFRFWRADQKVALLGCGMGGGWLVMVVGCGMWDANGGMDGVGWWDGW